MGKIQARIGLGAVGDEGKHFCWRDRSILISLSCSNATTVHVHLLFVTCILPYDLSVFLVRNTYCFIVIVARSITNFNPGDLTSIHSFAKSPQTHVS